MTRDTVTIEGEKIASFSKETGNIIEMDRKREIYIMHSNSCLCWSSYYH